MFYLCHIIRGFVNAPGSLSMVLDNSICPYFGCIIVQTQTEFGKVSKLFMKTFALFLKTHACGDNKL